ncbi:MAG TPA: hypothetical protein VHL34_08750, partial [Rhizomicrobium sp.]|nr:hypothetical protein [Rhizomicrobium sp.]
IQNQLATGGGGINLIAGWDGQTRDLAKLTNPGVFGNGFGAVIVGGEGAPSASVGAASGLVTVAAPNVFVQANSGSVAQIGYLGAGGGDIRVVTTGGMDLTSNGGTAHLGNGVMDGSVHGNVTGNIDINLGETLWFVDNTGGSDLGQPALAPASPLFWIGNVSDSASIESGNLTFYGGLQDEHLAGSYGFTHMIEAALGSSAKAGSGGDVRIALPGNSIDLLQDISYDSPHNLTLLTQSGVQLEAGVQNAGNGNLTLIAGWDGTTYDPAHLTDDGVYGNGFGGLGIGAENHDIAFGSKGGTTTVAALDITSDNQNGYSQIGYHGAGTGDINVYAKGDIALYGGNTSHDYAMIGHGSLNGDVSGNVSGNITAHVVGLTTFSYGGDGGDGGLAWLGNVAGEGSKASGNVSLFTGQVTAYGTDANGEVPNTLGKIMMADLGTSASTGGDFTLALTNPNTDSLYASLGEYAMNYSSPHDLTILSTLNITIANSIQNAGTGDLTILAGWRPDVAPADVLTTRGAYGNNGAFIWVVGQNGSLLDYNPNSTGNFAVQSGAGTAIGSKGGATNIGGAQVYVEGLNAYAQIGYHGSGGSGAINVIANGKPGTGNLTGIGACFDGNANICVIGGRPESNAEQPTYAQIGNLGMGVEGSSTADINVSATGNISVSGGGTYGNSDAGIADAYGMIGSGDAARTVAQNVSGNINVNADGQLNFFSSAANNSVGWLGNRTGTGGTQAGNVTVVASSMDSNGSLGSMFAEDLGTSAETGGDVTVGITGAQGMLVEDDVTYTSPHTLSLLSTNSLQLTGNIQNAGTGTINLVAGWDGRTLDASQFFTAHVFGNNNGAVYIGNADSEDSTSVGTKGGTTNIAAHDVVVGTSGGLAQIGYNGAGGGAINVQAVGSVVVGTSGAGIAQIGNGGTNVTNKVGGNISVSGADVQVISDGATAVIGNVGGGNASESGNISVTGSNSVSVLASGGLAAIGNSTLLLGEGGGFGSATGRIDVNAGTLSLSALGEDSRAMIGNGRANSTVGGNIFVNADSATLFADGANSVARIGHNPFGSQIAITGDIHVDITGDLLLLAGTTTESGASNAIIGHGGAGSVSGLVDVNADTISLQSTANGSQTRIGNAGNGVTGSVSVSATHDISLTASGSNASSLITMQGTTVSGDIDVTSEMGSIELNALGGTSTAQIGAGGLESVDGNVTVEALDSELGSVTLNASGSGAEALIGHVGFGEGTTPLTGTIAVHVANDLSLQANSSNSFAQIGSITGGATNIDVRAGSMSLFADGGTAMIGNGAFGGGGLGDVGGDIAIHVDGITSLSGSNVWIGNIAPEGSTGSGNLLLVSGDINDDGSTNALSDMLSSDLNNGDVTLGFTAAEGPIGPDHFISYDSPHTFNILSTGDIAFGGSLSNEGSGAINVVAGWDGQTVDAGHFGDDGVFGNGGHGVTIGASQQAPSQDASGVMVGSREGNTSVYGDFLTLDATNGSAQLGYHGAGQGAILVNVLGDITLTGGGSKGFFAQIGNGGLGVAGSQSGDIAINAGGDVSLNGGEGNEAYAQIGHGGAESNTQAEGYSLFGAIVVNAANVTLGAGSGGASYVQIGHGGYKAGAGLTGGSEIGGNIAVVVAHNVTLTGNGNDAYAQIGHGGDQLNTNAGQQAHGAISGDIVVTAPNGEEGAVTMTAGDGSNAYVQIGNGGYSINAPTQAVADNFTIGGNITITDLALTGGGPNGFAQIGNGDNSHTGYGNISGDILLLLNGGTVTMTDGPGPNANASIHNATGHGTVTGSVTGFEGDGEGDQDIHNPETNGTIVELTKPNPPPLPPVNKPLPDVLLVELPPPDTKTSSGPNPIEEMSGGDSDQTASDKASQSIGNSLSGGKPSAGTVLLGGLLKQNAFNGQNSRPQAVPDANQDYSSWGNEALWQ